MEELLVSTGRGEQLEQAQELERHALLERMRRELRAESDEPDHDDQMSEVWYDHPAAVSSQKPSVQLTIALTDFSGYLWKKSPGALIPIRQWKRRWFVLSAGRLRWFASEDEADSDYKKHLKGEIDFCLNPCTVSAVASNHSTQFSIRPRGGKWVLGCFTGADQGREFLLDALSSRLHRDNWIDAVKSHLDHGEQMYSGTLCQSFLGM